MPPKKGSNQMSDAGVMPDPRDHRRHERLPLETKVRYKVIQRQRGEGVPAAFRPDGRSTNISLCGLALVTEQPLKKGDYLKLELTLPGKAQAIRALAEIMWSATEGGRNASGIRFLILLNQADDLQIRRFIQFHPQRPTAP